jgi:anti-sigma factor RsiW
MTSMRCADVREVAPDVALGLLTGEERATALAHLEGCEACRAEVASLAGTADEVLLAAPGAAPPPGFADRVLARLAAERAGGGELPIVPASPEAPGRGSRRVPLLALAAAAVVLVIAGVVAIVRSGEEPATTTATAEMRTGRGTVVGVATVTGGEPATVEVAVPGWQETLERWDATHADTYWLAVETEDGTRTMQVADPSIEEWTMRVDAPAAEVSTVSVLDDAGRVWCSGRFAT